MKTTIHKIQGFTLTLSHDGETIYADIEKGHFCGSLAMAENTGELENSTSTNTLPVPQSVIEAFWKFEEQFSDSLA